MYFVLLGYKTPFKKKDVLYYTGFLNKIDAVNWSGSYESWSHWFVKKIFYIENAPEQINSIFINEYFTNLIANPGGFITYK